MNYPQLPVWAKFALAGSLLTIPPIGAANAQATTPQTSKVAGQTANATSTTIPAHLAATGLANPVGSQIVLTWTPVPRALGYKLYRDGQFLTGVSQAFFIDYNVAGGETHTYTVTSVSLAGESASSASASTKVPLGGNQVIYLNSLKNGWASWSWAAVDMTSSSTVINSPAMRVTAGPWQALYLHHTAISTAGFSAVSFSIYGGVPAGQKLWVRATRNGVAQAPVSMSALKPGQWQTITVSLKDLGVSNVSDMDGFWVQDASGKAQAPFYFSQIVLTSAPVTAPPPIVPPAAPTSLTATSQWTSNCVKCGGKAMAHILLAWKAVSGATSYTMYRNGAKFQEGLTTPSYTDMSIVSGQSYKYTVAALGAGGLSPQSVAASAVAPNPPAGQGILTAPTNLSVQGVWMGAPTDALTWSPVPSAVSYNLYQYDVLIAQGITTNSYVVPASIYCGGMSYTVTAVDSMKMESLPSALATALGAINPGLKPNWMPDAPIVPAQLSAVSEWNAGNPRIHLAWHGNGVDYAYNVYRDGQKVASGLWGLNYFDTDVKVGDSHVYTISGVNAPWVVLAESSQSAPITAKVLASAPASSSQAVQITAVTSNDDSVLVSFAPVPGAVDYRVYDVTNPNTMKYSGGGLSIEMNGLDPVVGANLIVEAVDKLGPFQKMDGMAVPGAMQMDGMHEAINGQGDPSNIPNVLAASAQFHVACKAVALTGSQVFFDNFRNEQPLTQQPMPAFRAGDFYGLADHFLEVANDKWAIRDYGGDIVNSKVFFMGNHFMDTLFDGGTPHGNDPMHNNDASIVMMPKATADISGGRVLHATFEVDSHFDSRRWCEIQVAAVGDLLIQPGKVDSRPGVILPETASGNSLRWQIQDQFHTLNLFQNTGTPTDPIIQLNQLVDLGWGPTSDRGRAARVRWDGAPLQNGTAQDLDKRHRFDLYLSQTHYRLVEDGFVMKDADFPADKTLPFSNCQVYFVHQVYHTSNDRAELINSTNETYWYNNRPWSDERHWDNMGQEVLSAFPSTP